MRRPGHSGIFGTATALGASLLAGCLSSALDADLRRVNELTHSTRVQPSLDPDVAPSNPEESRRLLAAPLDVDAAVRVAVLNNRELKAQLREIGIARGRSMQAGLLPNPRAEAEILPERNSQVELRVEYDLMSAILSPFRARAQAPDVDAARTRAAAAVIGLGYRVRNAYYALQAAEQRLALGQQRLDASAAGRDAARALHDSGNLTALDSARIEVAYERTRVTVAQLELELAAERERLQRLLGLHAADTEWRLAGPLPDAPPDVTSDPKAETRAIAANLQLLEARQRLEGLARRAGLTRASGWIPDLSVDVHALHGRPEDEAPEGEDSVRFGAGVTLELPLFDRRQGTALALESEFDAELERYYGAAVDVRSAAREGQARVASAHARARQYHDVIIPLERRVLDETLLQFNAMQLSVFQLLDARRAELDAQLGYIDTLREYWSAAAELEALFAGQRVSADVPVAAVAGDETEGTH
jgi:cobalt-zinc-cadmium efflux system outer membrane protein